MRQNLLRKLSLLSALSLLSTFSALLRGRRSLPSLLNLLNNRILQRLRLGKRRPPRNNLSIRRDQELLKVPLNTLQTQRTGHRLLHPGINRRSLVTVDIQFAQHGERHAIVQLTERLDLVVGTGVLAAELVAGEPEELKVLRVLRLELLVDLLEAFELRGEAALGGGVDDEDNFAFQGGEGEGLALFCVWDSCVSEGGVFFLSFS